MINIENILKEKAGFTNRFAKFQDFHNLMQHRIRKILLVSSLYDSYIFEEDGRLYELLRQEYLGLNLSDAPELIQYSSGKAAINFAKKNKQIDLIIATQHINEIHATKFAKRVKNAGISTPVVLLGYDNNEMVELLEHPDIKYYERVFYWLGDYKVIIGIIKYMEDKLNVEHDTNLVGIQSIILIEDSIRFYSSYLPMIYTELLLQAQSLLSEGINLSHRFLRMRARPKILLASSYEEATKYIKKYENTLLGIISDINFSRKGEKDPNAGLRLAKKVKKLHPDIPFLLQSSKEENRKKAEDLNVAFIWKNSPSLLNDLRNFMHEQFSFGDFIFRDENGNEIDRASNLIELEEKIKTVPGESLLYHGLRNHFSNWLKARTEFWLAELLKPKRVSDFTSVEDLRETLVSNIRNFRHSRQRGIILDFNRDLFEVKSTIARIGSGSLGGKARGIGFMNRLLNNFDIWDKFDDVEIFIPSALIIATDIFDRFLEMNNLLDFALKCKSDEELYARFYAAPKFPEDAINDLFAFLEITSAPLAVRSSSLLEDSQGQPFAGVYETFMLPNNNPDINIRMIRTLNMIKKIYASVFRSGARDYMGVTSYRLEEEKMAIIIQEVVGQTHGDRFYPDFSGVAKSYNFYPTFPYNNCDKIATVGFGLGKIIVDGCNPFTFCPEHPNKNSFSADINSILDNKQKSFFALDLKGSKDVFSFDKLDSVRSYPIEDAEKDGTLNYVASTYSFDNEAIYDGTSRPGVRIFSLATMLKHKTFPIAEILDTVLEIGTWGMSSPIEIEFAVNVSLPPGVKKQFALLQMRPLVVDFEKEELEVAHYAKEDLICKSEQALGNGIIKDICDIVFVDPAKFDRSKSYDVAKELAKINARLIRKKRKYLLIGLGRIGTLDPWLGIPVSWEQISGAKTIIETNLDDISVEPSQGSHFFHNLTSLKVGYFTVDSGRGNGFIDWEWLRKQKKIEEYKYVTHCVTPAPITIKVQGQENIGVIVKPNIE